MKHRAGFLIVALVAIPLTISGRTADAQGWEEIHKLLAEDAADGDQFGTSVDIDEGLVAVGAPWHHEFSGAVYLFDSTTGEQVAKVVSDDSDFFDEFGTSVAMDDGLLVVGAIGDDDNGNRAGAAYVFDVNTGQQIIKLLGDAEPPNGQFGRAVSIDDGVIAIGEWLDGDNGHSSGSAYLFDALTGDRLAKLLPDDGAPNDLFGGALDVSDGLVIVGAIGDDDFGHLAGSAYVFDVATGRQLTKLLPEHGGHEYDRFGSSVALDDGIAVVGVPQDHERAITAGAAYLFEPSTGQQLFKLMADDGDVGDKFGSSVAIVNGRVAIGSARDSDSELYIGSAYLFDAATGAQQEKMVPSDGSGFSFFGTSIAATETAVVVGATKARGDGIENCGAVYLYAPQHCLSLDVENLIAGEESVFAITGGAPGHRGISVYGTQPGQTPVRGYAGLCATFDIDHLTTKNIISGVNQFFNGHGEIEFTVRIPSGASGVRVLIQSAQHDTCPDECVSNLVDAVVG